MDWFAFHDSCQACPADAFGAGNVYIETIGFKHFENRLV